MNYPISFVFLTLIFLLMSCKPADTGESDTSSINHTSFENQIVLASCGQCQFGMGENGCDLAIRIDGHNYFVDGTKIDDHGDAHAHNGFCNAIRKAEVSGTITNGRFFAQEFKLVD